MEPSAKISVIVPLFPRHPGLRRSLAALRAQTVPPSLVMLVDNGTNPDAESTARELPGIKTELVSTEKADIAGAINHAVELLDPADFIAVLTAGGAYEPTRFERCLATMEDPAVQRHPGLLVTATALVDSQGAPLPPGDGRHEQLGRLWAPGRAGISQAGWLGAGDFVLSASNIFASREYLAANPLANGTSLFPYLAAVQAAMQGLLAVLDEPLLSLHWFGPEHEPSALGTAGLLRAQVAMLGALREKLSVSPETRRNMAVFRRAAWNNLSGLREDLFTQAVMQLAALAAPQDTTKALERLSGASDFLDTPIHLRTLRESADAADPAAYAAALAKTRTELAELREDHARLERVAHAAQDSGWVRFGAWLGERSARRIMEMDAEDSLQPPDGKVEGGGEDHPDQVGHKQP